MLSTREVEVEVTSLDSSVSSLVKAYTTNRVTGDMRVIDWNEHSSNWPHLQGIKFHKISSRPIVDILIGLDCVDFHKSLQEIRGRPGEPIARLTPLGWTCVGPVINDHLACDQPCHFSFFTRDIDNMVRQFWEIESIPCDKISPMLNHEEKHAVAQVESSCVHKEDGFSVGIPWRNGRPNLPNNFNSAYKRMQNTEKKLSKEPKLKDAYNEVINDYLAKNFVRKVPLLKGDTGVRYLPHFPVIKPDKATTKVRVVFDASASHQGISLNDTIHQGPKLQSDLFSVLLRFRRNPVAIVCDIAQMYLQIKLQEEDKPYHRFLWRYGDPSQEPSAYEFNRVVFGVNASPFLAQYVTQKNAELHNAVYPLAVETVKKSTYMDDSMDSVATDSQAVELVRQLTLLWGAAGMHPRKWLSNSQVVLETVAPEDRASEVDLDKGHLPCVKTLGVLWSAKEDVFTFKVNMPDSSFQPTKRSLLSLIARLFDPLGVLSPFVIRAKVLVQEVWISGQDWDEPLLNDVTMRVKEWCSELPKLTEIKIPRCLHVDKQISLKQLHTFVDASETAYGAATYLHCTYVDGSVSCRFVAARTRVAPLKSISIPRLELMAAVLGLQLATVVSSAIEVDLHSAVFWVDNSNVLWWIRGHSRAFKPFVANRIGEIQEATSPSQWRHVPTHLNPADYLTRGLSAECIANRCEWWNGPDFLLLAIEQWPENIVETKLSQQCEEQKAYLEKISLKSNVNPVFVAVEPSEWLLNRARFSRWLLLVRVQSWVNRFLKNCHSKLKRTYGELLPEEIQVAEVQIIMQAQKEAFPAEMKALKSNSAISRTSALRSLNPRLDEEGLLRSDSRLRYAEFLSYDVKFPIILPRKHWVTTLIIKHFHDRGGHISGTNQILSALSTHYWVISAREAIREVELSCQQCRRWKAPAASQIMAPLPAVRSEPSMRAFDTCSVDYGGPFLTVQGQGKVRTRRYLCLFTCMATRAVHLEISFSLDTDSFLNCFYRMVSRRGLPREVWSDNGTNFVGARRELLQLYSELDRDKIKASTSHQRIKWHFNPPLAPHFGGIHESMMKSAKRVIYAILSASDVTDEELLSAMVGAEDLINSRPITYQSANPKDILPLTPNHFLHGQMGGQFAPPVDDYPFDPRRRWRRVQELVRHFWQRWLREWLPSLGKRNKWFQPARDIQIDDVVVMVTPKTPRGSWPLGRVTQTVEGKDGHVRVVKVLVNNQEFTRPITRVCPFV